mgnify:CR=1 FL=1
MRFSNWFKGEDWEAVRESILERCRRRQDGHKALIEELLERIQGKGRRAASEAIRWCGEDVAKADARMEEWELLRLYISDRGSKGSELTQPELALHGLRERRDMLEMDLRDARWATSSGGFKSVIAIAHGSVLGDRLSLIEDAIEVIEQTPEGQAADALSEAHSEAKKAVRVRVSRYGQLWDDTVEDLKVIAGAEGLPVSGLKAELIERIMDDQFGPDWRLVVDAHTGNGSTK